MPHTATDPTRDAAPMRSAEPRTFRTWRRARRAARRANPAPITLPQLDARSSQVPTSAGLVGVREAGPADGPVLLFVHGLLVDGRMWDLVAEQLAGEYRCVMPDLPLGSHRRALGVAADRTPLGIARLVGELAAWAAADDVTVVAADSGCAITQLLMDQGAPGISRVVLATGDCFDHFFPPGFRIYQRLAHAPGLLRAVLGTSRLKVVRQGPIAYGGLTHRTLDDTVARAWLQPIRSDRGVFDDTAAFLRAVDADQLIAAEERLGTFTRPVLLAWAHEQRWFPVDHAERLAEILPDAAIREIPLSGAFPALDQPVALAGLIREFVPE